MPHLVGSCHVQDLPADAASKRRQKKKKHENKEAWFSRQKHSDAQWFSTKPILFGMPPTQAGDFAAFFEVATVAMLQPRFQMFLAVCGFCFRGIIEDAPGSAGKLWLLVTSCLHLSRNYLLHPHTQNGDSLAMKLTFSSQLPGRSTTGKALLSNGGGEDLKPIAQCKRHAEPVSSHRCFAKCGLRQEVYCWKWVRSLRRAQCTEY